MFLLFAFAALLSRLSFLRLVLNVTLGKAAFSALAIIIETVALSVSVRLALSYIAQCALEILMYLFFYCYCVLLVLV